MDSIQRTTSMQQTQRSSAPSGAAKPKETEMPSDSVELGKGEAPPEGQHKKWLIMNYIAGDCNLTRFQLGNIDQQEKVGSDANTHIVAMVDVGHRSAPMQLNGESWSGGRTLYVNKDDKSRELNSQELENHGMTVDMSNPETLKKFVTDTVKKFPADNVALFLNDHGGGFTGAMSDDTDGSFMSVPGIKQALKEAEEETGKKIDVLGFDACLMAEAEVGYELKDHAKIMLASEESEGGAGWSYDSMFSGKPLTEAISRTQGAMNNKIDVSPEEFAKVIVDVNSKHNNDIPTFSATNLEKMDGLKDSVNGLAEAIINTSDKKAVKDSIKASENYGMGMSPYKDLRDLHHLSRNLMEKSSDENVKKAAEEVKQSFEDAVFANENHPTNYPNSRGLTIYAPTSGSMGSKYNKLDFAADTKWDEAMASLGVKMDESGAMPERWPDGSVRKNS